MRWPRSAGALALSLALVSLFVTGAEAPSDPPGPEVPATGKADARFAGFDAVMVSFLRKNDVPGAALAVAKDGRVVYARGFGYADKENKEPVQPAALFRIASISKPLTAVAVLQLVERDRLRLDDYVFDVLRLKAPADPEVTFDPRWKRVTILHLLQHTGGWDRGKSFDPMFRSPEIVKELDVAPPAGPDAIIRYMLRRPLDFDPGKEYAYSNFGYCLLGRVVEKVSGQDYESYVRKEVLAPLGITSMKLGKTLPAGRAEGEVRYYASGTQPAVLGPYLGKPVPPPYGAWSLEAMDSHGGWLAPAEDLVRFAAALDRPAACKILKEKSVRTLFARPGGAPGQTPDGKPKPVYYGCGWLVRPVGDGGNLTTWHTGSLAGTSTLLVRRADGVTWAVLFNSREAAGKAVPSRAIEPLLTEAADAYVKAAK
jgi:CubicO group peptidase (beta-lactamase class C family)